MAFGDLSQTLTMQAVLLDGSVVQYQRSTADPLAFEAGAPHAGAHPLDDEAAFQFGDGADDDDDGAAQRAAGIDIFPEDDVLDVEPVEFVEHIEEVLHRPGHPVRCPDQDNIELAAAGIGHHLIEARPAGLGAGDPVGVLVDDGRSRAGRPSAEGRAAGSPGADRGWRPLIYKRVSSAGTANLPAPGARARSAT